MPLKAELDAVKKNYVKLMKLPVKDLLPALKVADVVSDDQREQMNAMTLDKERAGYLIDNVIITTLKVDSQEIFYNFLQVLENDDNPVVKVVANDLRSQLGPSMPPQPYGGSVHPPTQGQMPQPYPPYWGHSEMAQPPQPYQSCPFPQLCKSPTKMIEVEKILLKSSKKGIDPVAANSRNVHAVCLIRRETAEGTEIGTGFIANFTMPNSSSPVTVLVTNHHVIHNLSEALKATYQFSYMRSDSDDTPCPISGEELIPQNIQRFYTCKEYEGDYILLDYTLIQVHERPLNDIMIKSELDGETFPLSTCKFDLDNPAMPSGIDEMETVCILQYPRGQPLKRSAQGSVSVGKSTLGVGDHLLFYSCDTDEGSSGAPVFKVVNKQLRLIALHRAHWGNSKFNFGTLITDIIKHVCGAPSPRMNYSATYLELQQRVKSLDV